jgi:hypothetical protein
MIQGKKNEFSQPNVAKKNIIYGVTNFLKTYFKKTTKLNLNEAYFCTPIQISTLSNVSVTLLTYYFRMLIGSITFYFCDVYPCC